MKTTRQTIIAALLGAASATIAQAEVRKTHEHHASAEASVSSDGKPSSTVKKSVTVTSDGKQTIRKTITVRDGKEEVITEITDALGKVTRFKGNENDEARQESDKPESPATDDNAPWLGVRVQAASAALRDQLGLEEDEGVVIDLLAPDSPAAKADIRVNDILLALAETKLTTPADLRDELQKHEAGESIQLKILRKGQRSEATVVLEERKADDSKKRANPPPAEAGKSANSSKEEIHVEIDGEDGHASAHASSSSGNGLDDMLDDPNVPENFKKSLREMQEKMREFEKKHGIKPADDEK
jgi:membrane-associated protease RseP (regulator of RpoE activity)